MTSVFMLTSIDELVEIISSHPESVSDTSRAIRKALKNEDPNVQKRALTILEALVEFASREFQSASFLTSVVPR